MHKKYVSNDINKRKGKKLMEKILKERDYVYAML
jgi:hypothetical protein